MDFIGIGAQKSGTSWIYACLYDHPALCMPFKELHFFSRPRYADKGLKWYREKFSSCDTGLLRGEYSTSYLYSTEAAARIHKHFSKTKLIVSLRNPVTRAFSHYQNAIKAGEVSKETTFEEVMKMHEDVVGQGYYYEQLQRYLSLFTREQILVLIHEDARRDPQGFIQSIYQFLGVDDTFVSAMLYRNINTARTPKAVWLDRGMVLVASAMRKIGLQRLVWKIKKIGVADSIREKNTEHNSQKMNESTKAYLQDLYRDDISSLSKLLGRDLVAEWLDSL